MKAFEARILYFEKHVWFEHHIRFLAQTLMIKTKKKSLGVVIDEIASHEKFMFLKLSASELRNQKNFRNWLGHQYANTNVSEGMIEGFELVDDLNERLVSAQKSAKEDKKIKTAS